MSYEAGSARAYPVRLLGELKDGTKVLAVASPTFTSQEVIKQVHPHSNRIDGWTGVLRNVMKKEKRYANVYFWRDDGEFSIGQTYADKTTAENNRDPDTDLGKWVAMVEAEFEVPVYTHL